MNSGNLYINSIFSHSAVLLILITKPTRIPNNSLTIIDHIITNDSKHELQSFTGKSDLTDRYPILCIINKDFRAKLFNGSRDNDEVKRHGYL